MGWKRFVCLMGVALLLIGFSSRVWACGGNDGLTVRVQATLEATDISAAPPTITVLGLAIDVSQARLDRNGTEGEGGYNIACTDATLADLEASVGQVVEVKLASDLPNPTTGLLSATEVTIGGGACEDDNCAGVQIAAPIQALNPGDPNTATPPTITLLGLVIDLSQAVLSDCDDEDDTGDNSIVDVSQLMVGQFAKLTLASEVPPLAATEIDVKIFSHQVKVQAPLENADPFGVPQTISVLGLLIDVSSAAISQEGEEDETPVPLTCADLLPLIGETVRVKLVSDLPDPNTGLLTASAVEVGGWSEDEQVYCYAPPVRISAPIQAISLADPNTAAPPTITLLGLVIDMSQATQDNGEYHGCNWDSTPIDVSTLVVGQFARVRLASSAPPLAATTIRVDPYVEQVKVWLTDKKGNLINDGNLNDVQVDVQLTMLVTVPSTGKTATKQVKRVVKLHTMTNGSFSLAGLPAGKAKITVKRVHDGVTSGAKGSATVASNRLQTLQLRLKKIQ